MHFTLSGRHVFCRERVIGSHEQLFYTLFNGVNWSFSNAVVRLKHASFNFSLHVFCTLKKGYFPFPIIMGKDLFFAFVVQLT
jgi:hypothetical protein